MNEATWHIFRGLYHPCGNWNLLDSNQIPDPFKNKNMVKGGGRKCQRTSLDLPDAKTNPDFQLSLGERHSPRSCGVWLIEFWSPLRFQASLTRFELANKRKCPPSDLWEASDLGYLCSSRRCQPTLCLLQHVLQFWGKRNVTWKRKRNLNLTFPKSLFEA